MMEIVLLYFSQGISFYNESPGNILATLPAEAYKLGMGWGGGGEGAGYLNGGPDRGRINFP